MTVIPEAEYDAAMEDTEQQGNLKVAAALGAAAALLVMLTGPNPATDAVVTAAIAEEVTERACIAQYGPGERFVHKKPVCALGTRDVPATALSYPLARQ